MQPFRNKCSKCTFPRFSKEWQTDQPTDGPINQPTDMKFQFRGVYFSIQLDFFPPPKKNFFHLEIFFHRIFFAGDEACTKGFAKGLEGGGKIKSVVPTNVCKKILKLTLLCALLYHFFLQFLSLINMLENVAEQVWLVNINVSSVAPTLTSTNGEKIKTFS